MKFTKHSEAILKGPFQRGNCIFFRFQCYFHPILFWQHRKVLSCKRCWFYVVNFVMACHRNHLYGIEYKICWIIYHKMSYEFIQNHWKKNFWNFKFCLKKTIRNWRFYCHLAAADKNAKNFCYFIAKFRKKWPAT